MGTVVIFFNWEICKNCPFPHVVTQVYLFPPFLPSAVSRSLPQPVLQVHDALGRLGVVPLQEQGDLQQKEPTARRHPHLYLDRQVRKELIPERPLVLLYVKVLGKLLYSEPQTRESLLEEIITVF